MSLFFAFGPPFAAAAPRDDSPSRLEDWYKSPVRYLMNRTETKLFKRLDSNEERVDFIRRFWDRRDPDPRTPQNEARVRFWLRVAEANVQFNDSTGPGWKTDRGKIFILLGPADHIEHNRDYRVDEAINDPTIVGVGLLRWQYEGLRGAANTAITVIAFIRKTDEWVLTTDPKLSSIFLDINAPTSSTGLPSSIDRLLDSVPWGGGTLGTALDLGRLQEVPTERDLLKAVVRAEEFLGTYTGSAHVHEVADANGRSLTALTVALDRTELQPKWDGSATGLSQRFVVSARLKRDEGGEAETIDIPEEAWVAEPSPEPNHRWLRFQAIRSLPPGNWRLSAVIFDRVGGGAATIYEDVDVQEHDRAAPAMTGPILAKTIIPSPLPLNSTEREQTFPYRLVDHIVVPRMVNVLGPHDAFALYLEVVPAPGATGAVELEWQFYLTRAATAADDGSQGGDEAQEEPFGSPGRLPDARGPRAWQLPAGKLPAGLYRVVFVARGDGALPITREVEFRVTGQDELSSLPTRP